jgi:hypothetical protein
MYKEVLFVLFTHKEGDDFYYGIVVNRINKQASYKIIEFKIFSSLGKFTRQNLSNRRMCKKFLLKQVKRK